MALLPCIDNVITCLIVRRARIRQEMVFHRFRVKARPIQQADIVESVLYDMSSINDKSAALLQHISVILAFLALAYGSVGDTEKRLMAAAILIYLFNAFLLLRCLNIMGPPHMFDFNRPVSYRNAILCEVLIRRTLFVFSLRTTIFTSFAMVIGAGWFFWRTLG